MEEVKELISLVGVPAAMAFYVMFKLNETVKRLTNVVTVMATKMGVDLDES